MTVTSIHTAEPVQPRRTAPRPSAPMNSTVMAHVRGDTTISAIRRTQDSPLELQVGDPSGGTQVVLFLGDDADVIRLIDALQSAYPAVQS